MRQVWKQKMPSPQMCLITFPSTGAGGRTSDDANLGAEDAISPDLPHHFPFRWAWPKESDEANLGAQDTISPHLPRHFPFCWAWRKEK